MQDKSTNAHVPTQPPASLHRAAFQRALLLLGTALVVLLVFFTWGDSPLRTVAAWQRIAPLLVPTVVVASYLEVLADQSPRVAIRALGNGVAFAMVFFVIMSAERIAGGEELGRLAVRALVVIPVTGLLFAVPTWIRMANHEKRPTSDSGVGRVGEV